MPPKKKGNAAAAARRRAAAKRRRDDSDDDLDTSRDELIAQTLSEPRITRGSRQATRARSEREPSCSSVEAELIRPRICRYDIPALLANKEFEIEGLYRKFSPKDFTMDYYNSNGLSEVLLFDCPPEELGMRMVPPTFTVDDVMECVGGKRIVDVVEVSEQKNVSMTVENFVNYYKTPEEKRTVLYNVLSLEFSLTKLEDMVRSPALVAEIDWVNYAWPDSERQQSVKFNRRGEFHVQHLFPKVQNYCLMSVEKCFTDFHIDFAGTSVWYHVLRGNKIFWIIEPTETNIALYEEHSKDDSLESFFGNVVERCARVLLKPGNTLIIPSGWIHAVYTPVDSLVFGGNFLHSRRASMQCKVIQSENRISITKKYRFPYMEELFFYLIARLVKDITGRIYVRPSSRFVDYYDYVGKDFKAEKLHHRPIRREDYAPRQFTTGGRADVCFTRANYRMKMPDNDPRKEEYEKLFEQIDAGNQSTYTSNQDAFQDGLEEEAESDIEEKDGGENQEENTDENRKIEEQGESAPEKDDYSYFTDKFVFWHPEECRLDSIDCRATAAHRNPLLPEPEMEIVNQEEFLKLDVQKVEEYEYLCHYMMAKRLIDIPRGLTRPNSLLACFKKLLAIRRSQLEASGAKMKPCAFPSRKPRTVATRRSSAAAPRAPSGAEFPSDESAEPTVKQFVKARVAIKSVANLVQKEADILSNVFSQIEQDMPTLDQFSPLKKKRMSAGSRSVAKAVKMLPPKLDPEYPEEFEVPDLGIPTDVTVEDSSDNHFDECIEAVVSGVMAAEAAVAEAPKREMKEELMDVMTGAPIRAMSVEKDEKPDVKKKPRSRKSTLAEEDDAAWTPESEEGKRKKTKTEGDDEKPPAKKKKSASKDAPSGDFMAALSKATPKSRSKKNQPPPGVPLIIGGLPMAPIQNEPVVSNPYGYDPMKDTVALGQGQLKSAYRRTKNNIELPAIDKKKYTLDVKVDHLLDEEGAPKEGAELPSPAVDPSVHEATTPYTPTMPALTPTTPGSSTADTDFETPSTSMTPTTPKVVDKKRRDSTVPEIKRKPKDPIVPLTISPLQRVAARTSSTNSSSGWTSSADRNKPPMRRSGERPPFGRTPSGGGGAPGQTQTPQRPRSVTSTPGENSSPATPTPPLAYEGRSTRFSQAEQFTIAPPKVIETPKLASPPAVNNNKKEPSESIRDEQQPMQQPSTPVIDRRPTIAHDVFANLLTTYTNEINECNSIMAARGSITTGTVSNGRS